MNPVKLKIFASTFLLIFFYFPKDLNGFINNCDGRNCAERRDAAVREFERSPLERENRKMNVRDRVGSERLVNNRRIVDSDSRISENLASRSFDFPRLVERTRQSRVCDARRDVRLAGDRLVESQHDRRSRSAVDRQDQRSRVVRDRTVRVENRQIRSTENRQNRMTEDRQRRVVDNRRSRLSENRQDQIGRSVDRRSVEDRVVSERIDDRRSRLVEDRRTRLVENRQNGMAQERQRRTVEVQQNRLVTDRTSRFVEDHRQNRLVEDRRSRQTDRSRTISRDNRVQDRLSNRVEDRRDRRVADRVESRNMKEDRLTRNIREQRSRTSESDSSRRDVRQAQRTNIRIMGRETSERRSMRRNVDVNNNRQISERSDSSDRDSRFGNRDSRIREAVVRVSERYTKSNDISQWSQVLTTTFGVLLLAQIISSSNTKKFGVLSNFLHGIKEKIY